MAIEEILLKLEELRKSTNDNDLEVIITKIQNKMLHQLADEWHVESD